MGLCSGHGASCLLPKQFFLAFGLFRLCRPVRRLHWLCLLRISAAATADAAGAAATASSCCFHHPPPPHPPPAIQWLGAFVYPAFFSESSKKGLKAHAWITHACSTLLQLLASQRPARLPPVGPMSLCAGMFVFKRPPHTRQALRFSCG